MTDIILVGLLVLGFIVGFFRGAIRQLLAIGVWLVALFIAAYARPFVGDWLGTQWTEYSPFYIGMLSFGIVFGLIMLVGVGFAQVAGSRITLTQHEWVDDLVGGLLGVGLVLLTVAGVIVILSTAYAVPRGPGVEIDWIRNLYDALTGSFIGGRLNESLVAGLGSVIGPLLPSDVRAVML